MTGLVLASTSAIRRQVLRAAGLAFEAVAAPLDETAAKAALTAKGAGPKAVAEGLAAAKAEAASKAHLGVVIGADQTLDLGGELYDKVSTIADARERLEALRGRTHHLHAALAAAEGGEIVWRETTTTSLTMRRFSDEFLAGFLARNGEAALSSVGCYHLEGEGVQLFERIEGDYFAILGLPLLGLLEFLRTRGLAPQ